MALYRSQKGFTLIEAILVMVTMTLIAVAALPKIVNMTTQAKKGSRDHIVAAVREGILLQKVNNISETNPLGTYPTNLDNGTNGSCQTAGCFGAVFEEGQAVTDTRWLKDSNTSYQFDNAGGANSNFTYNSVNGTFLCTAVGSGSC